MDWDSLGEVNILITDDDSFNRQLVITLLSKISSINCFEAGDGVEAIEILEKSDIDMILLDLHMPIMDGYETLKQIKSNDKYNSLSIAIITTDEEEKKKLFQEGANDFISKPFDLKELEARIYENVQKRKYHKNYQDEQEDKLKKDKVKPLTSDKKSYTILEIESSQQETLMQMSKLLYSKEKSLQKHHRVALLSKSFAILLGQKIELSENLYFATFIMNIGKFFSEEDSSENNYKESIIAGYKLLNTFVETDFIRLSKRIMVQHKEHFDGTGEPQQLQDKEIHLFVYLVSIMELFDEISETMEHQEIYDFLTSKSNSLLHPNLINIFLKNLNYFIKLRESIITKQHKE